MTIAFSMICFAFINNLFLTLFFLRLTSLENLKFRTKSLMYFSFTFAALLSSLGEIPWFSYFFYIVFLTVFLYWKYPKSHKLAFYLLLALFTVLFCTFISFVLQIATGIFFNPTGHHKGVQFAIASPMMLLLVLALKALPQNIFQKLQQLLSGKNTWKFCLPLFSLLLLTYMVVTRRFGNTIFITLTPRQLIFLLILIIFGLLLTFCALSYRFYQKQKTLQNKINQQLIHYSQDVEQLYAQVSTFRHDYVNILFSLNLAIQQNDMNLVKQIYTKTIAPTEQLINNQSFEITRLNKVLIPELKSLLYQKVNTAWNKGLDVLLDIQECTSSLPIDRLELIRIVGILLDNAIENAEISINKQLHINILLLNKVQYLEIANSIDEEMIELDTIFQKGYTHKQADKAQHGLGLHYVKEAVDASEALYLETKISHHLFTQSLQIREVD